LGYRFFKFCLYFFQCVICFLALKTLPCLERERESVCVCVFVCVCARVCVHVRLSYFCLFPTCFS
jgi:hypothetical protein